jgi:hypothetical protein
MSLAEIVIVTCVVSIYRNCHIYDVDTEAVTCLLHRNIVYPMSCAGIDTVSCPAYLQKLSLGLSRHKHCHVFITDINSKCIQHGHMYVP